MAVISIYCYIFCVQMKTLKKQIDFNYCSAFITEKISNASTLLSHLQKVGSIDPHVAFTLLRSCAGFCKFAYVARTTPPSMATATFKHFDCLIHECFSECTGVNTTKQSWLQAVHTEGGLGLRSLSHHSTAAYISSLCNSECASPNHSHLASSIDCFNLSVMSSDTISIESCLLNKPSQHNLSDKLGSLLICLIPCLVLTGQDCCQYPLHMRLRG